MSDVWHNARESTRRKALCTIIIDGQDVTSRFDPHLLSVIAIDCMGGVDECHIELDDRDGRLVVPPTFAPVSVFLAWHNESAYYAFEGWVTSVESGFSRGTGGRRLWIDATGYNRSDGKSPMASIQGQGAPPGMPEGEKIPFVEFFQKAAKADGLSAVVGPTFSNVMRDYWQQSSESFMHLGQRYADELGGFFKISGKTAFFRHANDFNTGEIKAEWGVNLIEWRVKPYIARTQWKGAQQEHFDVAKGVWDRVMQGMPGGLGKAFEGAGALMQLPRPAPNKAVADQQAGGVNNSANAAGTCGWAMINGEPRMKAGMYLIIEGARPDVDGPYQIFEAHQRYERGGGYTSLAKLIMPTVGGAGAGGAGGQ